VRHAVAVSLHAAVRREPLNPRGPVRLHSGQHRFARHTSRTSATPNGFKTPNRLLTPERYRTHAKALADASRRRSLEHLRRILSQRVRDGVILRLIGKWLNAGVMEELVLSRPEAGTPQGGVISPLLANIFLHEVLDGWFVRDVRPRLSGRAELVRYADDFVIVFAQEPDARAVLDVLPKRFGKYGLTLHPDKTRLVPFRRPDRGDDGSSTAPGSYDLLGFTFHWGLSRKGRWVVRRRTAKDRFHRTLRRIATWCRTHRHDDVGTQHRALVQKLNGHYGYFGVTSNFRALARLLREVTTVWKKWLSRRSQRAGLIWAAMHRLLGRYPLPEPRIVHRYGT